MLTNLGRYYVTGFINGHQDVTNVQCVKVANGRSWWLLRRLVRWTLA